MDISFKKAVKYDAELLIDINNRCYYDDYVRYGECPGYNVSVENMDKSLENEEVEKHIIYSGNIPVGAVSIHKLGRGKYYLGNLCIVPEYQHKGIGRSAIDFVLEHYEDLREIYLITPADKVENIGFYTKKCGFSIVGSEMDGNVEVLRFKYGK